MEEILNELREEPLWAIWLAGNVVGFLVVLSLLLSA